MVYAPGVRRAALVSTILAVVLAAFAPAAAQADGDPASDVLLIDNAYTPYQPPSPASQALLRRAIGSTFRAKYPIQVAVIRARADLGAVPDFFGRPQEYAKFLYSELRKVKPRNYGLLVVMPAGFGTFEAGPSAPTALKGLIVGGSTADDLARAAIPAVVKLAKAAGHTVSIPKASTTGNLDTGSGGKSGGGSALIFAAPIGLLVLAAAFVATRRATAQPDEDAAGADAAAAESGTDGPP